MEWNDLNFTYWMWLIIALVLLGLELMVPGVFFFWISLAAGTMAALVWLVDLSTASQLTIFGGLSILSVLIGRRYFKQTETPSDEPTLNKRGLSYVGHNYEVVDDIKNGVGKIKIGDTLWRVEGPDLPQGSKVRVVDAKGMVLTVEAVDQPA